MTPLTPSLTAALQDAIAPDLLATLLERRTSARKPRDAKIEAVSATTVTLHYLQPVREYWWNPIPQRVVLTVGAIPAVPGEEEEDVASWVSAVAAVIATSTGACEPVYVYIPPSTPSDFVGIFAFLAFSLAIFAHIAGVRGALQRYVFSSDTRFNVAVLAHAGVLIKRSRDVRQLGKLLDQHWRGGRVGRFVWSCSAWVEGWRAVGRIMAQVEKVREERVGEAVGGETESKKVR